MLPFTFSESRQLDHVLGAFFPSLGLVSYKFNWKQYGKINRSIDHNRKLINEYGTIHHEIYHYLQWISEPFCYFLLLMEEIKCLSYDALLSLLSKDLIKRELQIPFWAYLNLPEVQEGIHFRDKYIIDENFQYANSSNILQELTQKGVRIKGFNFKTLNTILKFVYKGCEYLQKNANSFMHIIPLFAQCFYYKIKMGNEKLLPIDEGGVQITGEMILENAAFMISTYPFWHRDSRNSTPLVLEVTQHFGTTFYSRLIEFVARVLKINDAETFKNTFLSICHLSLNIPVNIDPGNFSMVVNWFDFHPGWRFLRILNSARSIPPIRAYGTDYGPFIDKICKRLGWQNPIEVTKGLQEIFERYQDDNLIWFDRECISAIEEKKNHQWKFFDPEDELFSANEWIYKHLPPIINDDFGNNVVTTRKKELIDEIVSWYIETSLPEQIFNKSCLNFYLPNLDAVSTLEIIKQRIEKYNIDIEAITTMIDEKIQLGYANYTKRQKYYKFDI